MYTMVLMMAGSSAGDTADFGFRKGGCTGAAVATAPAGCTGTFVAAPVAAPCASCAPAPVAVGGCTGKTGIFGGFFKSHHLFGGRSAGCTGSVIAAPAAYGYGGGCI